MTPISFPYDDIYEDGVVVSIQPNVYDEFSVQIQIQSLSISEVITFLKVLQNTVNISLTNVFLHALQIPPTVDKYYENYKYASNYEQYPLFYFFILTASFFSPSDGSIPQFW